MWRSDEKPPAQQIQTLTMTVMSASEPFASSVPIAGLAPLMPAAVVQHMCGSVWQKHDVSADELPYRSSADILKDSTPFEHDVVWNLMRSGSRPRQLPR